MNTVVSTYFTDSSLLYSYPTQAITIVLHKSFSKLFEKLNACMNKTISSLRICHSTWVFSTSSLRTRNHSMGWGERTTRHRKIRDYHICLFSVCPSAHLFPRRYILAYKNEQPKFGEIHITYTMLLSTSQKFQSA